jgi:hypothetical protein
MSEEGGAANVTAIPPVATRGRSPWLMLILLLLAFAIGVTLTIPICAPAWRCAH